MNENVTQIKSGIKKCGSECKNFIEKRKPVKDIFLIF